tara:strand:+ start:758 stop:862 length:105 start_codon:yes stop_codon:yes gene_type:complete
VREEELAKPHALPPVRADAVLPPLLLPLPPTLGA